MAQTPKIRCQTDSDEQENSNLIVLPNTFSLEVSARATATMSWTRPQTDGIDQESLFFDPNPKSAFKPGHSSSNFQSNGVKNIDSLLLNE